MLCCRTPKPTLLAELETQVLVHWKPDHPLSISCRPDLDRDKGLELDLYARDGE